MEKRGGCFISGDGGLPVQPRTNCFSPDITFRGGFSFAISGQGPATGGSGRQQLVRAMGRLKYLWRKSRYEHCPHKLRIGNFEDYLLDNFVKPVVKYTTKFDLAKT
jgi:hypothetical protein